MPQKPDVPKLDVLVVGAGFAGLYMLHKLRGLGLSVQGVERAAGVGGVWYWNRYPGARCDVESMQYSYSWDEDLQQSWTWSEKFSGHAEIRAYADHVADRFGLRDLIRFNTTITDATHDEATNRWTVTAADGSQWNAQHLVMATGGLSAAKMPEIDGIDRFKGRILHTGNWPHTPVSFAGERVAVIGTGSSGIQAVPVIAEEAGQLTVFQRTANFSVPARNTPMDPAHEARWKANYPRLRQIAKHEAPSGTVYDFARKSALEATPEEREAEFTARWAKGGVNFMHAYTDILRNRDANDIASDFVRRQIRAMVNDPATADLLTPKGHPIGAKRICVDSGYHATFNRDNVTLHDLRTDPIIQLTESGIRTQTGTQDFDSIVFATGYDALTGALLAIRITGRGGRKLADKWAEGPKSLLGIMIEGFPNLFTITGPLSPSVLVNVIVAIEQHVEWVADCIGWLRDHGKRAIDATLDAETAWGQHVNDLANATLFPQADSWYMGANVPGKPRGFMIYVAGIGPYRRHCDAIAANGYDGFRLT